MAKILLIEDDKGNMESLKRIFMSEGHEVEAIMYEGVNYVPNSRFSHAIIDGLKGHWGEVAKSIEDYCDKILIYSTDVDKSMCQKAAEMGYFALSKKEELQKVIDFLDG
ncbi:MAG: hypothetical protein V1866_02075 [archaeon]